MNAIIYRRVSSAKQDGEGRSLADQDSELLDYCRAMRWKVIGNFQDAVSGRREKTAKRRGLERALALACQEQATLVVYDLDRLARSQSVGMQIVERLKDCGAGLVVKSLGIDTNTPAGEMILGVMFAIAQWGSRNIGEGVKRANRQTVRSLGYRTQGRQPFGYKIEEGQRVKCPAEQKIVAQVRELYQRCKRKYTRTADALNQLRIPSPMAMRSPNCADVVWHPQTVKEIVERLKEKQRA